MVDEVTETTTLSWAQRLSRALFGVIFGLAFFILAFPFLWWNESRSVERIKALDAARGILVEAVPAAVDPANNSKLVHMAGPATTRDVLDDGAFGVRENALKLKRIVEMYQWKETASRDSRTNFGGSQTEQTTYSYSKVWAEGRYDSARFKEPQGHQNPPLPYSSRELVAKINFGAFALTKDFIAQIDKYDNYPLATQTYAAASAAVKGYFTRIGDEYFHGDPEVPQVGALRVHYQIIRPTDISVVGRQDKEIISPYDLRDPHGIPQALPPARQPNSLKEFFVLAWGQVDASVAKMTETIALLEMGRVDADGMIAAAFRHNGLVTWLVRGGGLFMMWIGLMAFFNPLKVVADFVPILGELVGASIALVTALVALILSAITIAAAWVYYRPLIGGALVLLAALAAYAIVLHVREARARRTSMPLTGAAMAARI
jgi:Transmembrane protein 43